MKPDYILKLETEKDYYSLVLCNNLEGDILKFLNERKFTKVFDFSVINREGYIQPEEVIFKSQQGFYLYWQDRREWDEENRLKLNFKLTIYYKIEQDQELHLFLSQLLKQYKNATINNRTT